MPYALHIICRGHEGSESPISREEWLEYLKHDLEFGQIDAVEGINPETGGTIRIPGDAMADWIRQGEPGPTFSYLEGRINAGFRGSDNATLHKMKEIAATFDALVIGDVGEEY